MLFSLLSCCGFFFFLTALCPPVSNLVYFQFANFDSGGSGFTAWNVSDASALSAIQADNYTLSEPGPNPERQDAPHPHQAILDPTGRFILLPDLGADLIRIYATSSAEGGLALDEREPLAVAPGSGPRHVAFAVKGGRTFMYLVTELANTIVGYSVTYDDENIAFEETWSIDTHGQGNVVPEGAAAAEILVSVSNIYTCTLYMNSNTYTCTQTHTFTQIHTHTVHLTIQRRVLC